MQYTMTSIISVLHLEKNQEEKSVSQNKPAKSKNSKEQKTVQRPASYSVHALK